MKKTASSHGDEGEEPLLFRMEQPGNDNMEHCGGTEIAAPQTGLSVAALGWYG